MKFIVLTTPDGTEFYVRAGAIDMVEPAPDAWQAHPQKRFAKSLVHVSGVERAIKEEEFAVLSAVNKAEQA